MGRDKLLLEVGGETLVERVAGALSVRCGEVIVAGGGTAPPGVLTVGDDRPGQGPLAGMEAGLAAARFPLVFVAAGDMPFLSADLVDHLLEVLQDRGALAAVPQDGGRTHPLCAAYSLEVLPRLRSALDVGVRAAREFLRGLDAVVYVSEAELRSLGDPDLLLMNVNSPEDLRRARSVVGA
ncbi:MAG: molybdenum cofactor guanylyltransferase [Actinomycetota bacterium]|nr:molybdenum cofactor guanylyltransferase [Actinomycetota bacterium]